MPRLGAAISLLLAVAAAPALAESPAPVQLDQGASPPGSSSAANPAQRAATASPAKPPREELLFARKAISEGRIAEAQESLERAVKHLRSSLHGRNRSAEAASHTGRAADQASEARQVLQAGHRKRALKLVDAALSRLNTRPGGKAHAHAPAS